MAKTVFSDGNPLQGILGTIVNALFLNKIFSHRHDGLDQDGSAPLEYAVATGAVNAYAVTLTPALTAHITGMPIRFKANLANTAACTLNVNGLGAVSITGANGAELTSGSIKLNQIVTVVYTGTSYELAGQTWDAKLTALARLVLDADKMIYATSASAYAATTLTAFARSLLDDADAATVWATLGATQTFDVNGYQKLPSGLIIQWGAGTSSASDAAAVYFPITFPNLLCATSIVASINAAPAYATRHYENNQAFMFNVWNSSGTRIASSISWIAIGY